MESERYANHGLVREEMRILVGDRRTGEAMHVPHVCRVRARAPRSASGTRLVRAKRALRFPPRSKTANVGMGYYGGQWTSSPSTGKFQEFLRLRTENF